MNRTTLAELKTTILDQADMKDSGFIDDTQLEYWINSAVSSLHDLLVGAFEEYFVVKYNMPIYSGQESYRLPIDFYKLVKVFLLDGTDRYQLNKFSMEELDRFNAGNGYVNSVYDKAMNYRILGDRLYLAPNPTSNDTLEFWYVPCAQKLVGPHDTISYNIPVGWEDYIVADCVIRCLAKEESDPSIWMARKAEIENRISIMAQERDTGESDKVIDVGDRWGYRFYDYDEGW